MTSHTASPEEVRTLCDFLRGTSDTAPRIGERANALKAADALQAYASENERLKDALTPSADTKAAYIGEFRFSIELAHPRLDSVVRSVTVPWDTTKEIMAAILARALKGTSE